MTLNERWQKYINPGRIGRLNYLAWIVFLAIGLQLLAENITFISSPDSLLNYTSVFVVSLSVLILRVHLDAHRLNDLNLSGYWGLGFHIITDILILIVMFFQFEVHPVLFFIVFGLPALCLIFISGTKGPNRFGESRLEAKKRKKAVES